MKILLLALFLASPVLAQAVSENVFECKAQYIRRMALPLEGWAGVKTLGRIVVDPTGPSAMKTFSRKGSSPHTFALNQWRNDGGFLPVQGLSSTALHIVEMNGSERKVIGSLELKDLIAKAQAGTTTPFFDSAKVEIPGSFGRANALQIECVVRSYGQLLIENINLTNQMTYKISEY